MASDRLLRWLCWSLIGFVVVSALFTLTLAQNPFATPVSDTADFVDRLLVYRGDDQKIYGLVLIGSLVTTGVYVIGAMLGPALRRLAPSGAAGDLMAVVFVVGGVIGVAAQLVNVAVAEAATRGYCDCGYKTYEVIAQTYALEIGWAIQFWMGLGAIVIVGIGAAMAGRVVDLSRDWRLLSYLIAVALLVGAALQFIGQGVASQMLVGLTAGIAVPIWAFLLARGSGNLAGGSPTPA